MAMKQEANAPLILTIGAMSGFLILVIFFGVEAWFRYEERNEQSALWEASPNTWLDGLRTTQRANLSGIDDAMKKFAATGGKPAATQPANSTARAD